MSRRRFLLAFPAVASAALGVVAFAAWSVLGHGTPTVGASMLGTPGSVNASQPTAGVGTVHVTWNGVTGPNGGAVSGYYVQRFSGATPAVACGSSAGSLLPATPTACDDTGVAAGTYTYKVTAVYVSWSATSGASNALTVVLDATPLSARRLLYAGPTLVCRSELAILMARIEGWYRGKITSQSFLRVIPTGA